MQKEYVEGLAKFRQDRENGQYLIFQEFRDSHGGDTYPVVDVVSFGDDLEDDDPIEVMHEMMTSRHETVQGWCDSVGYDGIVFLELWDNGEAYLSGVNHGRYRVVGMFKTDVGVELSDSSDLTDRSGNPVYWEHWMQDSWDDIPGIKVEFCLQLLVNGGLRWVSRKAFAKDASELEVLVNFAKEELSKPKYSACNKKEVRVDGKKVWPAPADADLLNQGYTQVGPNAFIKFGEVKKEND